MNAIEESHLAFHRGTAVVFDLLSPAQIQSLADLEADTALVPRLEYLAERSNEGELTEFERTEYEGYVEANNWLAILKSEARYRLKTAGTE